MMGPNMTIMIVGNDPTYSQALSEVWRFHGYEVPTSHGCAESKRALALSPGGFY
jgi:ActR/RegA family two-component response regulator